jgi:anti-sigma regulatory factor (Ser/Thr protein kinase)
VSVAEALTARFDLPADPRAAGRARRLVTELLASWGRGEDAEVARLLVSEVVTNAVRFAGSQEMLQIDLAAHTDRVRIAVRDGSALRPIVKAARDDDEAGRGMHLVAALASEWGVVDGPAGPEPGKHVWFELAAPNSTTVTGVPRPGGCTVPAG